MRSNYKRESAPIGRWNRSIRWHQLEGRAVCGSIASKLVLGQDTCCQYREQPRAMIVRPVRFALLGGSRISKMPLSRSRKLRPCGPFCRAWITALASRTARACPAACGARRPRRAGSRFPFLTRPGRKDPSAHKRRWLMRTPTSVEPGLAFVDAATLIVADVARSTAFYRDVPGAFDASGRSVNPTRSPACFVRPR